jgi:hypothetical protein
LSSAPSWRAGLLGLGALILVLSCRSDQVAASPLALYPGSSEGLNARLRGKLEMTGDCLYITREGGERWLAAFPSPGTTWDAGNRSVRIGNRVLRVGDPSGFDGGEISGGASGVQWVQAPGGGCDSSKIWLVTALAEP